MIEMLPLNGNPMSGNFLGGMPGAESLWAVVGVLAVLALIDSTSFGTLLIPIWLLMAPGRLRAGRVLLYLLVVAGAYAVIGLVLLGSLLLVGDQMLEAFNQARESSLFLVGQAVLAAGLIWYSLRLDPMTQAGKERKRQREEARGSSGRVQRFRERAVGEGAGGGVAALLALALAAVGLEIATLLPYLAGIGFVAAEDPGMPLSSALILFYCLVMVTPALVLLAARVLARRLLEEPLKKLEVFLSRHANGTVALILFLVGLFLGLNALEGLQEAGPLEGLL
ncbi:GAP family protein [Nesterenkonia flava]|uniref:GAP family protein n=1 Tax=Nesterenkonia flava TaxID=469799 RepID=A0ABU1FTI7_9MICC|nr:GAP family protein [Nesterenkonia flava]MDR5711959.1 GAP family protein [Nesterenkonia flava]